MSDLQKKDPGSGGLGRLVRQSLAWTMTGRGVVVLTNLAATVVLARLLEPEDFGLFGIGMLFTGLAHRFGNVGLGVALIQRKEIRDDHVSSLFTINLLIFPCVLVVLVAISPLVGSFFDAPLAGRVLAVTALVFVTSPFSSVARALIKRRMEFKWVAVASMVNHLVGASTSIVLALAGFGVWSLVWGRLLATFSSTGVLLAGARWWPRIGFSRAATGDLYPFGIRIFLKNLMVYSSDKVDYFIIGKRIGPAAFGLYEKAFNIMDLAVKEVAAKITAGVVFSAFSRLQDDRRALRAAYGKAILTISLICLPFFSGLFLVAPSFVYVVFGEKWMPSVLPLQILCVAGLLRMYLQLTSTVVNALGKVGAELGIRLTALVILSAGCWVGSYWDIVGVAVAVAITNVFLSIAVMSYLGRITGLGWADFVRPQVPAFVAASVMAAIVWFYQRSVADLFGPPLLLFSSAALGVVAYATVLGVLRPHSVSSLIKEILMDFRPVARQSTTQ